MRSVSVIIPTYNSSDYIELAIRSCLNQSVSNIEVIVCDDASTDTTVSVIKAIADPRLHSIQNRKNLGPGLSRDRAISTSTGRWVALLDADDAWHPDRLSLMLDAASLTGADVIFDDVMMCHNTGSGLIEWCPLHGRHAFGSNGRPSLVKIEDYLRSGRLMVHPMIRTDFLREHDIRHTDRRFAEDAEFILRLAHAGARFCYVPAPMYLYRITPGSLTAQANDPTLMRQVIEACTRWPGWSPSVLRAFDDKITMLARNEQLYALKAAIRGGQMGSAVRMLAASPSLLLDAFQRLPGQIAYHRHRSRYGGTGR